MPSALVALIFPLVQFTSVPGFKFRRLVNNVQNFVIPVWFSPFNVTPLVLLNPLYSPPLGYKYSSVTNSFTTRSTMNVAFL